MSDNSGYLGSHQGRMQQWEIQGCSFYLKKEEKGFLLQNFGRLEGKN